MSAFDYSHLHTDTDNVLRRAVNALLGFFYRIKVYNTENIPTDRGFIIAANHLSCVDPLFVSRAVNRMPYFMAKKELFDKKIIAYFFTKMNAFPISRGSADIASVNYAITVVNSGEILGIFPEGSRSKTGRPGKAKSGVALIARETKADILPVSVHIKNGKLRLFSTVRIYFGEVIPYNNLPLGSAEGASRELKECAKFIMDKITALWEANE